MKRVFAALAMAVFALSFATMARAEKNPVKAIHGTSEELSGYVVKYVGDSSQLTVFQLWFSRVRQSSTGETKSIVHAAVNSGDVFRNNRYVFASAGVPEDAIRIVGEDPLEVSVSGDFALLPHANVTICDREGCFAGSLSDLPATAFEVRWKLERVNSVSGEYSGFFRSAVTGDRFTVRHTLTDGKASVSGVLLGEGLEEGAPAPGEPMPVAAEGPPTVFPPVDGNLTHRVSTGSFPAITTYAPYPIVFMTGRLISPPLGVK